MNTIRLGYSIPEGKLVDVPIAHMAVTGQTQVSGKTTTLEALVSRSGLRAITFVTKRGEGSFAAGNRIQPYFRDRADWQFVTSIIDATLQEKNKFLRPWIMKICRTTKTLREVQGAVRVAMKTAKGINEGVYTQLDEYLELIVPEIARAKLSPRLDIGPGLNVMDVSDFATPMQMLFVQSALDWINAEEHGVIAVIPEAWEFIPEGKGSPVKASAITLARKGAAIKNFIWVDSQDMAGVDKTILRACTVWIIGVQREANEIKRTLANIPAGMAKPKPEDIALLERGQFFACYGRHCIKTYVQPAWMAVDIAQGVAMGEHNVTDFLPPKLEQKENPMWKERAEAAQAENAQLKTRIAELEKSVNELIKTNHELGKPATHSIAGTRAAMSVAPEPVVEIHSYERSNFEASYEALKKRLIADAPAILRVIVEHPAMEIVHERKTINANSKTPEGLGALLLKEGFFDAGGATSKEVLEEMKRRGREVGPNVGATVCKNLAAMGFLTLEKNGRYKAVAGIKVNVIQG